ncbi:hypothetical protein MSAN_00371400 [Mycena sanguinolenta]|uniref:Uncharacterized protein n=1 Tax=Mycena sanguinolenta TaxID=230812 RepID=A0A8H6ZCN5_9AGAR|nr:hypothetical protein MSAN_00371400 [Mycena sanguinolenta]
MSSISKTVILAAVVLITGARAQCPNNGIDCNDMMGFITAPGSWNQVATKSNLNTPSDLCGTGYTKGAYATCDGDTVVGINPPGEGRFNCAKANIPAPGSSSLGAAGIDYCCN